MGRVRIERATEEAMSVTGGAFTGAVTALSPTVDGAGGVRNIFVLTAREPGAAMGRDGDVCIVVPGGG